MLLYPYAGQELVAEFATQVCGQEAGIRLVDARVAALL